MDIHTYLDKEGIKIGEFARSLGVSRDLVYQWVNGIRPVAPRHCWPIEKQTNGSVSRFDLRPSDWQELWPDMEPPPTRRPRKPPKVPD